MRPEIYFSNESKFYIYLKQKTVTKSDYESSKFLLMNLKMRNLDDMNDLFNAQNVILLL